MKYTVVAVAAFTSTLLLAGCTTAGSSSPPVGPSTRVASSQPSTASGQPGRTALTWRGASINLADGWRKAAGIDQTEQLCLLRTGSADAVCGGDKVDDWLYLYASERSGGAEGEPGHPDTLDASGMNGFTYDGGVVPCQTRGTAAQVQKGTRDVGGRLAYYGEWKVECVGNPPTFIAQRWVLPKSRIGVVSYALTEQSAEQIRQMITTMDLSGYQPTAPK
jgi:hypothetical protein